MPGRHRRSKQVSRWARGFRPTHGRAGGQSNRAYYTVLSCIMYMRVSSCVSEGVARRPAQTGSQNSGRRALRTCTTPHTTGGGTTLLGCELNLKSSDCIHLVRRMTTSAGLVTQLAPLSLSRSDALTGMTSAVKKQKSFLLINCIMIYSLYICTGGIMRISSEWAHVLFKRHWRWRARHRASRKKSKKLFIVFQFVYYLFSVLSHCLDSVEKKQFQNFILITDSDIIFINTRKCSAPFFFLF